MSFEQIIVPEALEPFLSFDALKSIIVMNKEIRNKFLIVLHKRTMWDMEHLRLQNNWKCVYRLKLKWDDFEILPNFTNLKELQMIYTYWTTNEMSYFPNGFPNTLTLLHLGNHFRTKLDALPPNLKRLVFGNNCKIRLGPGILPNNLKELICGTNTRIKLNKCKFPNSLDMIGFGTGFCEHLEPLCSLDLKQIYLNIDYKQQIPHKLKDIIKFVS
jgi:hypothetical protein